MSERVPVVTPKFLAEDLGPQLIATASCFITLSTIFVGLRYYARYLTKTRFGLEDIIIPFAWLAEVGLCTTVIMMVKTAGAGRHMAYNRSTDPSRLPSFFQGVVISELLHLPAVAFTKLCVIILYLRVFTNKYARLATWCLVYIVSGTWVAYTIATAFQCVPLAFKWDKTIPGGRCFDVTAFAVSSSVPNIVSGMAIMILPIRTILDLKVSVGRKIGLGLIFLTGSVGIIASIIRTVVLTENSSNIEFQKDITYTYIPLLTWTVIEPGLYLLAACAISFKPLFRMLAKALHLDAFITHRATSRHSGGKGMRSKVVKEVVEGDSESDFSKRDSGYDPAYDVGKGSSMGMAMTTADVAGPTGTERGIGVHGRSESHASCHAGGPDERCREPGGFNIMVTRTVDMDVRDQRNGAGRPNGMF